MTKQLQQLLSTLNLHKRHKKLKKRNSNQKLTQIEKKKQEKLSVFLSIFIRAFSIVQGNIKSNNVPLQLEQ